MLFDLRAIVSWDCCGWSDRCSIIFSNFWILRGSWRSCSTCNHLFFLLFVTPSCAWLLWETTNHVESFRVGLEILDVWVAALFGHFCTFDDAVGMWKEVFELSFVVGTVFAISPRGRRFARTTHFWVRWAIPCELRVSQCFRLRHKESFTNCLLVLELSGRNWSWFLRAEYFVKGQLLFYLTGVGRSSLL